jgi:hypothetical protein
MSKHHQDKPPKSVTIQYDPAKTPQENIDAAMRAGDETAPLIRQALEWCLRNGIQFGTGCASPKFLACNGTREAEVPEAFKEILFGAWRDAVGPDTSYQHAQTVVDDALDAMKKMESLLRSTRYDQVDWSAVRYLTQQTLARALANLQAHADGRPYN